MRTAQRIKKLEARHTPGPGLSALVIPRRPGESREEAEARYFAGNPERRGDTAPRIYLTLMQGQDLLWVKALQEVAP